MRVDGSMRAVFHGLSTSAFGATRPDLNVVIFQRKQVRSPIWNYNYCCWKRIAGRLCVHNRAWVNCKVRGGNLRGPVRGTLWLVCCTEATSQFTLMNSASVTMKVSTGVTIYHIRQFLTALDPMGLRRIVSDRTGAFLSVTCKRFVNGYNYHLNGYYIKQQEHPGEIMR